MSQKRNRSVNWDEEEKQLFRTVFKDYAHIIENKCNDTNTNKKKSKAWEELHKKFNELNSRTRDLSQLKIQWKSMKIHARKACSMFKKELHKTGGGARPATPDNALKEIKDLLNPAELLRDCKIYDSDGMVMGEVPTYKENQQLVNISTIESIGDIDTQVDSEELTIMVSQDIESASEIYQKSLPIKMSEDDPSSTSTKTNEINPVKKVPKRKLTVGSKPRKDQEYVSRILSHSKHLKDEEHRRRMEMADEEHEIKMQIHKEKLKSAILEREILEIRKASYLN